MIAMIVECVSKGNVIVHEQVMAGSLAGVSSHVHRPITNLHIRSDAFSRPIKTKIRTNIVKFNC